MNIFSFIILGVLFLEFILELASNLLNLKSLKADPPGLLKDIYPPDKYAKSQQYLRENTQFGIIVSVFGLVLFLVFWFLGGFNWLDLLVRSWGFNSIVNGLLYTGLLALGYSIIMLPASIYSTFTIEQRYGFNRTSPLTFITDRLKGLLLGIILGAPLLAAVLALFELTGPLAWLYCWAALSAYLMIIEFIAPNWIMPLFNKFTPLEQGDLKTAIMRYAESVHFPIKNVFVIDGSKRSSKSNAFFTGFGRNKRIALFDTLIAQHTIPELVAVLAHEIGHYKKKHIIQSLIISILHFGLLFYLLSLILNSPGLYQAFYMANSSVYTGLIFFGLLYTPVEMLISILLNMLSRKNETEADRFAVSTMEEPAALGNALKKLAANNLSNLTPHPFYAFLHYSHPPLLQRIQDMQSTADNIASQKHR